jgi:hypothetical protein
VLALKVFWFKGTKKKVIKNILQQKYNKNGNENCINKGFRLKHQKLFALGFQQNLPFKQLS